MSNIAEKYSNIKFSQFFKIAALFYIRNHDKSIPKFGIFIPEYVIKIHSKKIILSGKVTQCGENVFWSPKRHKK